MTASDLITRLRAHGLEPTVHGASIKLVGKSNAKTRAVVRTHRTALRHALEGRDSDLAVNFEREFGRATLRGLHAVTLAGEWTTPEGNCPLIDLYAGLVTEADALARAEARQAQGRRIDAARRAGRFFSGIAPGTNPGMW